MKCIGDERHINSASEAKQMEDELEGLVVILDHLSEVVASEGVDFSEDDTIGMHKALKKVFLKEISDILTIREAVSLLMCMRCVREMKLKVYKEMQG